MRTSQGQAIHLKDYRRPDYRVATVDLDFDLQPERTRVKSRLRMERQSATSAVTPLKLDGDEVTLISVSVNGKKLASADYSANSTQLMISKLPKDKAFDVEIETEINPTTNTKLMGLYRSGGNYCTQCEAEGFRRITYFPDRPDVLSVYTTRIEASRQDNPVLLGNGNLVRKGSAGKGRHYAIWHDPHPKPSYLFALVAGDLGSVHKAFKTTSGKRVRLGIYVEKGKEHRTEYAMDSLVRSMKWDEEVFGCEYDLDVFNIVAVSDFNMGAMENKGLNIFNDKYVLGDGETATDTDFANIEGIIAHEYFHNWTGNRITCRDWFQLCLKEGLTVFRDQEFSSDMRSRPVKRIADVKRLKNDQFPEDAGPLAHAVRPETYREINNFYTATVYEKGAELVRMLATILGEKKFRKGMDAYLKRHDGDAATIEDFISCFERAAKIDLGQFKLWYSQAGTPVIAVSSDYNKAKKSLIIEAEQVTPATPGQRRKAPQHIPQRIGLLDSNGNDMTYGKVTGIDANDDVFHLTKRKHKITIDGVVEKPVLSLNRGFTAPVEINYPQSDQDLAFLAANDSDSFSRWQALQAFGTRLLVTATKAIASDKKPKLNDRFTTILSELADDKTLEPAYRAALLQMPSETDIAQAMGKYIDPAAIAKAHLLYSKAIGKTLEPKRVSILSTLQSHGGFQPDAASAGKRTLANVLMNYGVKAGLRAAKQMILDRYHKADNMTDRFNALACIVHHHGNKQARETVLADFYDRYKDNHIVLDKWFSVQASVPGPRSITNVRKLMKHPDFTMSNPNRLRSLVGVFAMANPSGFNAANGRGYTLAAKTIATLDKSNPQVAARMLTAFRSYKTLEPKRRKLAENALKTIEARKSLSTDVADILTRTLTG
ncbi:MAG: aminopeptidase N [Pseudomonadota bacterium]